MIKFFKRLFKKVTEATYENRVLTVKFSDGSVEQYYGSCTCWNKYPMMESCSTSTELWLHDIWLYIETHGNPYPTAHQK